MSMEEVENLRKADCMPDAVAEKGNDVLAAIWAFSASSTRGVCCLSPCLHILSSAESASETHECSPLMERSASPPRARPRQKSKSRSRAQSHMQSRRDYLIGILLLLCVVVLWTSSNFVTQVCATLLIMRAL